MHSQVNHDTRIAAAMRLLRQYDLEVTRCVPAESGSFQQTYIVDHHLGKVVIRVQLLKPGSLRRLKRELLYMEQLANHNVPVPDVITTRLGKKYALASSQGMRWLGLVTQFYPGQSPQEYTPQLRSGLAEYQARAHAVALQLPSPRRVRIESPLSCYAVNSSDRKYRHPGIRQLVARASAYTVTPDQSLPVALVHLDMDAGNVLAQEDQIHAVIDFGHVSYAPLSACLANTLWHVFITTKTETAVLDYLRVYETIRPLQQNEYRAIQEYALMRHYTVTLLCAHAWNTPEEEMHSLLAEEQQILEVFSRIATRATSQERA